MPTTSVRSRRRRLATVVVAAVTTVTGLAVGLSGTASSGSGHDPTVEHVPRPEYVDDARSFVAAVDFTTPTAATGAAVTVAALATPGTEHLQADLVVRSESENGLLRSFSVPHPAMSFAHGPGFFFEPGRYDLVVPFDARAETLRLRTPAGGDVAVVDTAPAIRAFCTDNPSHPDCLEADLAVGSVHGTAPLFAVMGQPVTVAVTSSVTNSGPDGPVAVRVVRSAVPSAGLAVMPTGPRVATTDLAVSGAWSGSDDYEVTCVAPGAHTLDVTVSVSPVRARVVDPDPSDDTATHRLTFDCAVPVTLNIKPGSRENPAKINGGVIPMAVLSTAAGEYGNPLAFDATRIDAGTVRFGSMAALLAGRGLGEAHGRIHPEHSVEPDERTVDRDLDAVLHVRREGSLSAGDRQACVFGRADIGGSVFAFVGCDKVDVRP